MNKKMIAPIVVAVLLIVYFVFYAAAILTTVEMGAAMKVLLAIIPLIFAGYAIWAAKERIEEIKGGEEDDLSQY